MSHDDNSHGCDSVKLVRYLAVCNAFALICSGLFHSCATPCWSRSTLVHCCGPKARCMQLGLVPILTLSQLVAHLCDYLAGAYKKMPLLLGPSRKRFLGELSSQKEAAERDFATAGALAACVGAGADIVRVHNVRGGRDSIRVADGIHRGWWPQKS